MESLNDVGSITYFNADGSIHETVTFNNQERYLEEAKEALKTRGITGWKCNTLSKDLNLHYELSQTVAACYPCSYSSRLDLHGMFLGYTMSGGNFFLDILQRQANVTNSSFCIIGAAGQGKSWLMKKIITFLRMFGVRSFSLDPENEYVDLTKNLNGTIYNCIDGKAKINPLEVRCLRRDDDDEDDKYVSELNNLPIFFQHAENPISVAKKMKEWENDFFHPAQGGDSKRHNMIISSAISFDREQEYREKCQAAITRSLIYNLCRSINQDNERGKKVLAHTSKTTKKIQPKRITARKAARMEPIRPE